MFALSTSTTTGVGFEVPLSLTARFSLSASRYLSTSNGQVIVALAEIGLIISLAACILPLETHPVLMRYALGLAIAAALD
jgi:hypothetical protein